MRRLSGTAAGLVAALLAGLPACAAGEPSGRVTVAASFYPLAWAAGQVGGPGVDVEDLTPPGGEPHGSILSARQRGELETASLIVILGQLGFQPDVERAALEVPAPVLRVTDGMGLSRSPEGIDPHVWLDPVLMAEAVRRIAEGLATVDPAAVDRERERSTLGALGALDAEYRTGLLRCRFRAFVVAHEAFGYLAARYGLTQLGIESLAPESEPSAERLQAAIEAIRAGRAAPVVFYEPTDEGRRIGESLASDIGVPALALSTIEFAPESGDYLSAMRANLVNLAKGLQCG